MTSAPSPIARHLLGQLLDVIPEFTDLEPYRDKNFNTWRTSGSHALLHANSKAFVLKVTQRDYAGVLFAEGQHLLNHAAEQRAHLLNLLNTKREPSPSWALVTLYYCSLFVAMAWTRASNGAIMYLDKDAIAEYCLGAPIKPGGGAYEAIGTLDRLTGISRVEFKKCGASHFHEAVWIAVHKKARELFLAIEQQSLGRMATSDEILALRGLDLFDGLNFRSPQAWPSKLRNGINYRPGFSYRSVVKNNFLRITSRLAKPAFADLEAVVSYGEHAKNSIRGFDDPTDVANESIDLLVAQMIFLEKFTDEAFFRLCEIQNLRSSAFRQRKSFVRNNNVARSIINPVL